MDAREAIRLAKTYIEEVYQDEQIANLGLEEVEHAPADGRWVVGLAFSRPWNTPKSRAQEVLEGLGALSGLKRSFKILTISDDGQVISMKDRPEPSLHD